MNQSEAIILSKRAFGDSDFIITFFSEDYGLLKGIAKYARKSVKRFSGCFEPGYVVDFNFNMKSTSSLSRITECTLKEPKTCINRTLHETSALWVALEIANYFSPEAEVSLDKYRLLRRFITSLYEGRLTRQILIFFIIKWIVLAGYEPCLNMCVNCDSKASLNFDINTSGLVCENCSNSNTVLFKFTLTSLENLKKILIGNINHVLSNEDYKNILEFLFMYMRFIYGKQMKMEAYLPMLLEIN